jgi:uncharacterized protein (TIGR00297 family)
MSPLLLLAIGLPLNSAAGFLAYRRRAVDAGGAIAGTVLGTLVFVSGGPFFWVVLGAFFVSSTIWGLYRGGEKEPLAAMHEKGGRRDLAQVIANGGVGAVAAGLYRLTGNPGWAIAFAISFASSNADTWASELGVLSRREPISILTFRRVPRGVSGGVSPRGIAAALAGALFISLIFAAENFAFHWIRGSFLGLLTFVTAGGFFGSLLDSILGATLQAQYAVIATEVNASEQSAHPAILTERRATDGRRNRLIRGLAFVTNDVVNLASCAAAAAAGFLLFPFIFPFIN